MKNFALSLSPQIQKIMAFEKEIKEYEDLRCKYQTLIINKMDREEYIKYKEVLFSLKSASNLNGNLNCSKELEHYAS